MPAFLIQITVSANRLNHKYPHQKFNKVSHLYSLLNSSTITPVTNKEISARGVQLDVKRDDLIHPIISGNKWRKLKYLLLEIESSGLTKVAAMGGAYSNFLHALSYVCCLLGWHCQLYIRGYVEQPKTPTLKDCIRWGAEVTFVDRIRFKKLRDCNPALNDDVYWIREGGQHESAIKGIAEIFTEINQSYDQVFIASATGTSVAGLAIGAAKYQPNSKVTGVSVLKNTEQQVLEVKNMLVSEQTNWKVLPGYEFGGFAKVTQELVEFTQEFNQKRPIQIEPIYTGKSFYAVLDMINKGLFNQEERILVIHCGGLQGTR